MKLLCDGNLSLDEKTYLARLSLDPGFVVLRKLMENACEKATAEVIKLDPVTDNYDKRLAALQWTARAKNSFATDLIASIMAYAQSILNAEQVDNEEDEQSNPLRRATTVKFPVREDLINQRKIK